MKKTLALLTFALAVMLTGCAAKTHSESYASWRESLLDAKEIVFDALITARWEESAADFSVHVTYSDGDVRAEVTAPETIAGIAYRQSEAGAALEFEDLILELDAGRDKALAPCSAPGRFLAAITEGYPLSFGREDDNDTVAIEAPDGSIVTLWRTSEDIPRYAELSREGVTELTMRFANWELKE